MQVAVALTANAAPRIATALPTVLRATQGRPVALQLTPVPFRDTFLPRRIRAASPCSSHPKPVATPALGFPRPACSFGLRFANLCALDVAPIECPCCAYSPFVSHGALVACVQALGTPPLRVVAAAANRSLVPNVLTT